MEQLQAVVETRSGFRLDPRTKLLLMAVVATAEFLYSHTAFMIAVALIPFVLLLTNRQYKTAIVFFCLFTAGLFVQAVQNSIQFPMVINMLVVLLVGLVLRLFPAFVMGAYIIKSTTASECITALGRMHIGRQITIPLSVLFRFIPTMQEESAAIKDAMRMREVQFGTKKFWQNPAALIEYRFIPLMISVPQGEIIGIIGNNGAGKSTFARCLCGLDKRALGELELNGHSYRAKQRCHISYMVMQDVNHQLFTEDVLDELLLSMDGEDEKENTERANQILSSLDLADKIKLHPMSLSGGEKQRVAIGSAIASNKEILVFDEPTSGLDYFHMVEVSDNLNRLKDMGKSLFLITHDPELIYKCCTYLLFIQENKVLWHRPMDDEAIKLLRAFFSHEKGADITNAS